MILTSHQLLAFQETARARHFTKTAEILGITQSALSQRITNLEDELHVTLFIRDPKGPILTEAGETLLRYCQVSGALEQEVLGKLNFSNRGIGGIVRIAGYSSVLPSAIVPALAPFLRAHPSVRCEFRRYEVTELAEVLKNAEADFVVADFEVTRSDVKSDVIGMEEYVVIESAKFPSLSADESLYLDHGPDDTATESFFAAQAQFPKNFRRSFMGDVEGILRGVELGLGRAVMSRHLLKNKKGLKVVKGFRRVTRTVTVNYFQQPYYTQLQEEILKRLSSEVPPRLQVT